VYTVQKQTSNSSKQFFTFPKMGQNHELCVLKISDTPAGWTYFFYCSFFMMRSKSE